MKNTEIVIRNACLRSLKFNIHADLYYGIENVRRNEAVVTEEEEFTTKGKDTT